MAENFRKLVAETVPSAVLLHLLPDPDTCNGEHHQLDPENLNDIREENPVVTAFTLDSLSPMKPLPPSLDGIKERGKAIKRKLQFTDDEIDSVEKGQNCRVIPLIGSSTEQEESQLLTVNVLQARKQPHLQLKL